MFIQITLMSVDGTTQIPTLLNLDCVEGFELVGNETIVKYRPCDEEGDNCTAVSLTTFKVIQEKLKALNLTN